MIRLQRVGRKNNPSYRIVVTDKRTGPKSNKHIDLLGSYNPKLGTVQVDGDKAKYWMSQGAQTSVTLHNILISQKVIEGKKINALTKKSPIVDEAAIKKATEEKVAAEAKAVADAETAAKVEEEEMVAPEVVEEVVAEAPVEEEAVAA